MIGRLHGLVLEKNPPEMVLDVSGVGYEVQLPMTCFYQLPAIGEKVSLYTHFVVREDAQLLFGFVHKHERTLFRELIKANGVGPKLALTILSGMSAEDFVHAVSLDDVSALVKLPGVGKKTAERLLVEMKDKLAKLFANAPEPALMQPRDGEALPLLTPQNGVKDDAVSALLALGYKAPQAKKVVDQVFNQDHSSEELIRDALKAML